MTPNTDAPDSDAPDAADDDADDVLMLLTMMFLILNCFKFPCANAITIAKFPPTPKKQ